jgi:hypothetical protein
MLKMSSKDGRVLLSGDPAVFHVEALEDCGVEHLAGAVTRLAIGVPAAGGQRCRESDD